MSKEEKRIYKKRIIVENTFSWIFKNRRIINTYAKKKITYIKSLHSFRDLETIGFKSAAQLLTFGF